MATLSASLASASLQEFRAACTLALREAPRTTVHPATVANEVRDSAVLLSWLYEQGWSRYGWPESVGGLGGPATLRGEVYDELAAQGLSIPAHLYVLETVGPAVLHFAPELAAELLPAAMAGRELWCQGFSEPEAGSDLASLRTRATEHGDELRVSGQKIWTSYGALAQRMVALIRTGEADSRHRGLTMLLLDLDAPGVTARPIALASGREELAEVFFDDTPVPRSRVIGEINGGWAVAMHLLQFERGMYAWMRMAMTTQRLQALLRLVPADAPGAYETIGRAHLAVSALRARTGETLRRLSAGETVGPETSVDKVLLAAAEQGVMDAAHELLPTTFLYDEAGVSWRDEWWYSRAASIYGGAGEIQRTIIADRLLGLPKEDRGR